MTTERWKYLWNNQDATLTPEEIAQGWHFCNSMDGLLANSSDPNGDCFCELNIFRKTNPHSSPQTAAPLSPHEHP